MIIVEEETEPEKPKLPSYFSGIFEKQRFSAQIGETNQQWPE